MSNLIFPGLAAYQVNPVNSNQQIQGDATKIQGRETAFVGSIAQLPSRSSIAAVSRAAAKAKDLKAQSQLLSQQSKGQLEAAQHAAKILNTRLTYSKGIRTIQSGMFKSLAEHSMAMTELNLNDGVTQDGLNAYQANFTRMSGVFS